MSQRFHSTLILVAVFVLGVAGASCMIWAWPGMRMHLFPHHRPTLAQYMKPVGVNATQLAQVEAIFKETGERRHEVHLQFVPQYAKVCDDFTQVRRQERDAYTPVGQQELTKLQAVMTPAQWQKFQQLRSQQHQPSRPPDLCRHLYPGSGGRGGPGGHPSGPPSAPPGR